jgi:hypothetical protein
MARDVLRVLIVEDEPLLGMKRAPTLLGLKVLSLPGILFLRSTVPQNVRQSRVVRMPRNVFVCSHSAVEHPTQHNTF